MTVRLRQRLLSRSVLTADGCLQWTGALCHGGYGRIKVDGRGLNAHRLAYELAFGPIPPGFFIDHLCHVPSNCDGGACLHRRCINPAHLALATPEENVSAERAHQRTAAELQVAARIAGANRLARDHCRRGHPYDAANTHWDASRPGRVARVCRACRREDYARRKAA